MGSVEQDGREHASTVSWINDGRALRVGSPAAATLRAIRCPSGCSAMTSSIVDLHGSCSSPRMRFARIQSCFVPMSRRRPAEGVGSGPPVRGARERGRLPIPAGVPPLDYPFQRPLAEGGVVGVAHSESHVEESKERVPAEQDNPRLRVRVDGDEEGDFERRLRFFVFAEEGDAERGETGFNRGPDSSVLHG